MLRTKNRDVAMERVKGLRSQFDDAMAKARQNPRMTNEAVSLALI